MLESPRARPWGMAAGHVTEYKLRYARGGYRKGHKWAAHSLSHKLRPSWWPTFPTLSLISHPPLIAEHDDDHRHHPYERRPLKRRHVAPHTTPITTLHSSDSAGSVNPRRLHWWGSPGVSWHDGITPFTEQHAGIRSTRKRSPPWTMSSTYISLHSRQGE